eukprot:gene58069-biopygen17931
MAGTPVWSQEIQYAAANPVSQPYNVMYSLHYYAGSHLGSRNTCGGSTDLVTRLAQYRSQIPIFVTEWGTSCASGAGGPYPDNAKYLLDIFSDASQGALISSAMWSTADKAEASAMLREGACNAGDWGDVSCAGEFIRNYSMGY